MHWEAENTVTIYPDSELLEKEQPSAVGVNCKVQFGKKKCMGVIAAVGKLNINNT